VADCAAADAVMAGEEISPLEPIALAGLRLGVAEGLPLDRLDDTVAAAFALAVKRLDDAGARVTHETFVLFDDMGEVNAKGGISPYEACEIHRDRMNRRAADIDPNVRDRVARGCAITPADYADMVQERGRLVHAMDARLATLDALLMPTTSIVAPTIAEVADSKIFAARNAAVLRNTAITNFFDLCAISLPLKAKLPVGLMLIGRNGHDHRLLRIAAATAQLFGA
jgi:aspartyl-tRNA(Asn)/glutamyl-tRNA(Gln) amidotransferase subunit A